MMSRALNRIGSIPFGVAVGFSNRKGNQKNGYKVAVPSINVKVEARGATLGLTRGPFYGNFIAFIHSVPKEAAHCSSLCRLKPTQECNLSKMLCVFTQRFMSFCTVSVDVGNALHFDMLLQGI